MNKENIINDPEVMAYTYQIVEECSPFMTENTQIVIEERKASKIAKRLKSEGTLPEDFKIPQYCFRILMTEEGARIVEYGFGENPYQALDEAKNKLIKQLGIIQDEVISNSDRINEVNSIINGDYNLH